MRLRMECPGKKYTFRIAMVILLVVPLKAITVKPARCPTNKIAPHRIASYNRNRARTFGGAFVDLLTPDGLGPGPGPVNSPYNDLQEQPDDDQDDCGEIEDYDETDLSSITPQTTREQRRQGKQDTRFLFGLFLNRPQQQQTSGPITTTRRRPPPTTYRPQKPPTYPSQPTYSATTHPFWSGGLFGNNPYRPPLPENPSDSIKPVHEHDTSETMLTYWPQIVGGPQGNIVGFSPARPTVPTAETTRETFVRPTRYPQSNGNPITRPRPGISNGVKNSVIGSFFDLLF